MAPLSQVAATSVAMTSPAVEEGSFTRQKILAGAPQPIGTPTTDKQDSRRVGAFEVCDIFSGQERPNSAPPPISICREQRQCDVISPPPKDESPARVTPAPTLVAQSPACSPGSRDTPPELLNHPVPRRPLQGIETLLESEVCPPHSPEANMNMQALEKPSPHVAFPVLGPISNMGVSSTVTPVPLVSPLAQHGIAKTFSACSRVEPFASTPSPDRDAIGSGGEEWMDTPYSAALHRSVQNTPEPTHYYANFAALGGRKSTELPISTPSPGMFAAGVAHHAWAFPPRFPQVHEQGAQLPQTRQPGFGSQNVTTAPGSVAALSQASAQTLTEFMALHGDSNAMHAALLAQAVRAHGAAAAAEAARQQQAQGMMQGLVQAAHQYQQTLQQQTGVARSAAVNTWPLQSGPLPAWFPPPPHCTAATFPSLFATSSSSSSSSSATTAISSSAEARPVVQKIQGEGAPLTTSMQPGLVPAGASAKDSGESATLGILQRGILQKETISEFTSSPSASAPSKPSNKSQHVSKPAGDLLSLDDAQAEVNEFRGQVLQLSKTQAGSKYLQRQLLRGHAVVVSLILEEIEQDIVPLMCDAYGNYLCSEAFKACGVQQRQRLLERLAPNVAVTACDKRGTHALQALIGMLKTPGEQEILARAVSYHVIELCKDVNGTHVVQRLLLCFMQPFTDFIYTSVIEHIGTVAHHPQGLCVLKKCISQAKQPGKHQALLVEKLAEHALDLVQDQYGNYAIQHAFEEWGGSNCTKILQSLEGRMVQLSVQKCSSNVVEKILSVAPLELRRRFINELIYSDRMSVLMSSHYGPFVVKRVLQVAEPMQVRALLDTIRTNLQLLQNRQLKTKWEKVVRDRSDQQGDTRSALDLTSMLEPAKMVGAGSNPLLQPSAVGKQEAASAWRTDLSIEAGLNGTRPVSSAPSLSLQQQVWGQRMVQEHPRFP